MPFWARRSRPKCDDPHHLLQEPSRWGRREGAPAAGADRPERAEARQGERPAEDDKRAAWAPSRTTGPGAAPAGELPLFTRASPSSFSDTSSMYWGVRVWQGLRRPGRLTFVGPYGAAILLGLQWPCW